MAKAGLTPAPTIRIAAPQEPIDLGPPLAPPFDPLGILPAGAAEKLRALRLRASEAHALIVPFSEQQDLSTERLQAEQRLKRLLDAAHDDGFNLKDDDARVVTQKKLVAKLTDDVKRLSERSESRSQAWRSASGALVAVEDWLRHGRPRGVTLQDHEAEPVKLAKGEALLDAIEARRRKVREVRVDLAKITAAPMPSTYCKKKMREMVEVLAQRGAVDVSPLVKHDNKIIWPTMRVQSQVFNAQAGATAFAEVPDTLGLLVWLHRDALIAALDREITSEADDKAALTPEARQQREAEVMGDLLSTERDESALVWRAMDERLPVEHRADVNPVALLGLRLVTTARVSEAPGTTPGLSWPLRR
jgi:hypothetical protein